MGSLLFLCDKRMPSVQACLYTRLRIRYKYFFFRNILELFILVYYLLDRSPFFLDN